MLKKLFFTCQMGACVAFCSLIGEADDPQLAIDGNGNAVAFWEEIDNSYYVVRSARYATDGGWQAAQTFSGVGGNAFDPEAMMNADGDTIAVWRQNVGSYYATFAATSVLGDAWNTPVQLSSASSSFCSAGIDSAGRGLALWQQLVSPGINCVATSVFTPGSGWSAPSILSGCGSTICAPKLKTSSTGRSIAAWQMPSQPGTYYRMAVQAAFYSPEEGWSSPLFLSDLNHDAVNPSVAINTLKEALVVWEAGSSDGSERIYAAPLSAEGSWGPPISLSDTRFTRVAGGRPLVLYASYPNVACNDAGEAVVVWQVRDDFGRTSVRTKVRSNDGTWGSETLLAEYDVTRPEVAMNASGKAVAIWISGGLTIFAAVYNEGVWGQSTLLSDPNCAGSNPEVRINPDGSAFVVWQSAASDAMQVMASILSVDNVWGAPVQIN